MKTDKLKFQTKQLAIASLLFLVSTQPCHGSVAQAGGAQFLNSHELSGTTMELQGLGIKRVLFMKAFAAGFYYEQGKELTDPLADVAKRVEVEYFVDIPGKKLNNFTIESMLENITEKEFKNIQREVELMRKYFVDLKKGDRYVLTYVPDVGTEFQHNGQVVGVIEGKEFAKALFSTWVGERPFDKNMKKQILGSLNKKGGLD